MDRFIEQYRVGAGLRMKERTDASAAFDDDQDELELDEDGMRTVALYADGRFFSAALLEALRLPPAGAGPSAGLELLRIASQRSVAWRGCVTLCLQGCALDLRYLSQPMLSRQRDVQRLIRGLFTAPSGSGHNLFMRAFQIVNLKAPPPPEPPKTYLVAALEEIEELSDASHLKQRAGASTLLQLYDRRIANLVLDAYVQVALHRDDSSDGALISSFAADGDRDDAEEDGMGGIGADAGIAGINGPAPEAAWYLAEDGAPPLHYNQLVAMKGTKHAIDSRLRRQKMAHRRLHGVGGSG